MVAVITGKFSRLRPVATKRYCRMGTSMATLQIAPQRHNALQRSAWGRTRFSFYHLILIHNFVIAAFAKS
jgi:hypothetical protein